jgi:hypothetical protein
MLVSTIEELNTFFKIKEGRKNYKFPAFFMKSWTIFCDIENYSTVTDLAKFLG